ncbi:MAG: Epimerase family protein [Bacteroidia bacterium]|nr:Epimerase family protein [Bacteroidia bacterium]
MNILLAGGTGLIGRKLTERLVSKAHTVFILSRKEINADSELLKFIKWDGKEIPETKSEFDVLINLSGEPVMDKPWSAERKKQIIESRTASTFAFVDYINASKNKPGVLINASAVGYYGNRENEVLTEESPSGNGYLAEVCEQWEKAASFSNIRTVLLRTGIVLSNQGGAFKEIMRSYGFGFGSWFGNGEQGFPWIHIEDEIGLILFAIENERIEGALNLTAPELISNKMFIQTLGKVSGKNLAFGVPSFALELGLGERAQVLLDSQFVKPEKALASGYHFKYPIAESALKNLLNL